MGIMGSSWWLGRKVEDSEQLSTLEEGLSKNVGEWEVESNRWLLFWREIRASGSE